MGDPLPQLGATRESGSSVSERDWDGAHARNAVLDAREEHPTFVWRIIAAAVMAALPVNV